MDKNVRLWRLTEDIRKSDELFRRFRQHQGTAFFEALEATDAGRAFLMDYRAFIADYGHRDQADRDIYFPRRSEDQSVDYNAFSAFLSSDISADPLAREHETNAKRNTAISDVAANLAGKPMGFLRVRLFKAVLEYVQQFLMYRDNERDLTDRITFSVKRGFLEINRRLMDRGVLRKPEDLFFLSREELYEQFQGRADAAITQAKIGARSRDFHRFLNKEFMPPMYISGGRTTDS